MIKIQSDTGTAVHPGSAFYHYHVMYDSIPACTALHRPSVKVAGEWLIDRSCGAFAVAESR